MNPIRLSFIQRSCYALAGAAACLFMIPQVDGAILQPDKVVVVVLQDRASDVLGRRYSDTNELVMPYLNGIAQTGLVYSNSHGVTHPSLPNSIALLSGQTDQLGIEDDPGGQGSNSRHYSTSAPNLAKSLLDAGYSFAGFSESLPQNGSQVPEAAGFVNGIEYPDLYTRNINPMAMFTDLGQDAQGDPRPNALVNRTFAAYQSIAEDNDFSDLPDVSFVVANNLNNTHGSNQKSPWAGSPDEQNNDLLRERADNWLQTELDGYLHWARQNNSLLIITQDEQRWTGGSADTITTLLAGDTALFDPGENDNYFSHYNLLRTLTQMYGLNPLGVTGDYSTFDVSAGGKLTVPEPATGLAVVAVGLLLSRRSRIGHRGGSR